MNNKLLLGVILFLLLSWISATSFYFACKMRNNCTQKESVFIVENGEETDQPNSSKKLALSYPTLSISDGDLFNSENELNIHFAPGEADLIVPEELASNFASINQYLSNNPEKKLTLSGLYTAQEDGNNELGMKRANSIATYLSTNYGIPQEKIIISAKQAPELYIDAIHERVQGGVEFGFEGPAIDTADEVITNNNEIPLDDSNATNSKSVSIDPKLYENILSRVKSKKTIFYPPSGFEIEPNVTNDLRKYFKSLKLYFNENPDGLIKITGHTDNRGNSKTNLVLSKKRADKMKNYLIDEYGINPVNLKTSGRGDTKPKNRSNSDLAEAQNRRVTFTYIK